MVFQFTPQQSALSGMQLGMQPVGQQQPQQPPLGLGGQLPQGIFPTPQNQLAQFDAMVRQFSQGGGMDLASLINMQAPISPLTGPMPPARPRVVQNQPQKNAGKEKTASKAPVNNNTRNSSAGSQAGGRGSGGASGDSGAAGN